MTGTVWRGVCGCQAWSSAIAIPRQVFGSRRRGLCLPRATGGRRARRSRRAHLLGEALGEGRFAAAWAAGRAMSLDQAIAYALEEPSSMAHDAGSVVAATRPPGIAAEGGLTEREREVASLV